MSHRICHFRAHSKCLCKVNMYVNTQPVAETKGAFLLRNAVIFFQMSTLQGEPHADCIFVIAYIPNVFLYLSNFAFCVIPT